MSRLLGLASTVGRHTEGAREKRRRAQVVAGGEDEGESEDEQEGVPTTLTLVILCGAPGSGKSTFARALIDQLHSVGKQSWVRVCQDSCGKDGKKGSREQCLKQVERALREEKNVIVDRCHATPEQRKHFVDLCHAHAFPREVTVVAVVFNLALKVLHERVKRRENHEGGVQGKRGVSICTRIHSQLQKAGMPRARDQERLSHVTIFTQAPNLMDPLASLSSSWFPPSERKRKQIKRERDRSTPGEVAKAAVTTSDGGTIKQGKKNAFLMMMAAASNLRGSRGSQAVIQSKTSL
jgi:predicted kinase